ncbi:hypothetical protein [Pseudoxanthomonas sacheonensis]|uniref:HEAT repeat domain-containing protein n=1 Tax=Pseudoxanthomonas sacheonensis TaxID=443615 RepID=A0ABU1RTI5_9GAMM|nr:hypothetical protein [Pseudoxanthomonas sacheonensis]MDR6841429.1 hypothetical protein [Pseudoxanthomonas sacheonensis]
MGTRISMTRLGEEETQRLLDHIPYVTLAKQGNAKRHVERLVRDAEELESMLLRYPQVKYEPLDPHYVLLKCMANLDATFIDDLCNHFDWRGVVFAGWFAALRPDITYRESLVAALGKSQRNDWLLELALAEIDNRIWALDPDLQQLIRRLRSCLQPLLELA